MTLPPGARLGPYEILAPLGAGGMGEVYRARDTKLDRDIAVKVLPERLASDPAALSRFEREAKTVAALSHPNLLGIYDFGQHGGVTYAVTELLSGETLRDKLAAGPIPRRKAIDYALQIAHGLAAAHEHGVAHRDLKPENVFVTNDGRVKILDFGLAKPLFPESEVSGAATFGATEPGTVLGTVGYMSPEQVRGRQADHRSDIFAFGAILYEMLSGQRAFKGDSAVETMNSILIRDLPEPSGPPEDTLPPLLDRIVRHCLEKNPEERFQSVRDVAFDLETASGTSSTSAAKAMIAPVHSKRRALVPLAAVATAALIALAYFLGERIGGRGAVSASPRAFFSQQTEQQGIEQFPSLSPDGKTLVFVSRASGNDDIYLQRVGGHNPINLTKDSPDGDTQPAFSPDGSSIAFRSERGGGGIFVMGATGESVRRVTDSGFHPTWSPDGKEIAFSTEGAWQPLNRAGESEIWAVEIATGTKRRLYGGDGIQPSWSPRGKRIAFWGLPPGTGQRDIWTIPASGLAKGEKPVPVTDDAALDWDPVWSPDGKYLYFGSDRGGSLNLWRVSIDETTGKTRGAPEPVTTPSLWSGHFSIARDGREIAYFAYSEITNLQKFPLDPSAETIGRPVSLLRGSRSMETADVSPDGEWVAFRSRGRQEDLFVVRSDGTGLRQLTDDAYKDRGPRWSPDGRQIGFYSNRAGGRYEIWTIHPDGSGLAQLTKSTGPGPWFPDWSPDGKRLAIPDGSNTYLFELGKPLGAAPLEPLPPFPEPGHWFNVSSWSPDGRTLVGAGERTGVFSGGVVLYSMESRRYERLTPSGSSPIWLADGRRLLYWDNDSFLLLDTKTRKSRVLASGVRINGPSADFSISRDNRFVYIITSESEGDIWVMSF